MDVESKILRLERWREKQTWLWRISRKSPAGKTAYTRYFRLLKKSRRAARLKKLNRKDLHRQMLLAVSELKRTQNSYLKHCRRMQRYAKRGQLVKGRLYCKAGREITPERIAKYEAMCHFMVRKFLPGLGLWEASLAYEDLVNECRREVCLALMNGFDPNSHLDDESKDDPDAAIQKLEQTIIYGRLKSYLRRLLWRYHPDQLGGKTWCYEQLVERRGHEPSDKKDFCGQSQEVRFNIFTEPSFFPVDFIRDQQDRLMEILDRDGPEAVKQAFMALDSDSQEVIQNALFRGNAWSEVTNLGGDESCSLE